MTRRLFVCHATADIEATSELVDALENALNFGTGSLWTSGLPGYSAEPNDMPALGAALAGSDVVLALVTLNSVQDAQFHFQLGAAWALGAHTVLFLLDAAAQTQLPNALNHATIMRGHEPSQWSELIGDLSVRLGLVPRPGASSAPAITPSYPPGGLPAVNKSSQPTAAALESDAPAPPEPMTLPRIPLIAPPPVAAIPDLDDLPTKRVAITDIEPEPEEATEPEPARSEPKRKPTVRVREATDSEPERKPPVPVPEATGSEPEREPAAVPVREATISQPERKPPVPEATISQPEPELEQPTQPAAALIPPPPAADLPPTRPKVSTHTPPPLPKAASPASRPPSLPPLPAAIPALSTPAAQQSYLEELRAITERPNLTERTPPRYSYIDALRTLDPSYLDAADSGSDAIVEEEEAETGEQLRIPPRDAVRVAPIAEVTNNAPEQPNGSDVFARLPTCEMALEAGRAVSDCLFNRDEIDNFAAELDQPLGHLIECLGASWLELRGEQDLDTWVAVTDHLLQTLPDEVRKVEEWYRVGFELATLHNLAGQLVLDGTDAAAEQHWRGALERFLMRAERAEIGYENLGRVLGLLENLAGPSHERDLSNIPRSLEELRRYAAGADIHTAA
ncbi:MAG TPA: hypothetical protein VFN67_27200 [Polyangiales bacterium]|nr:hypothetical protein [Polyangiales bacterium]